MVSSLRSAEATAINLINYAFGLRCPVDPVCRPHGADPLSAVRPRAAAEWRPERGEQKKNCHGGAASA